MTKPRILIVEDESALAKVVRDYLLADGMEVDMLSTGTQAVETALTKAHDLVILDLSCRGWTA